MFESQDDAVAAILADAGDARSIVAGDVVVIRYEGPKGGPGMQEMLYPTSYLKSKGWDKACALLTDGRFFWGVRRVYPSVTSAQKPLKVVPSVWSYEGDTIEIDILIADSFWRLILPN